jgi:hypothetical protein
MDSTPATNIRSHTKRSDRCQVCGSETQRGTVRIVVPHWQGTFDCVECALTVADRGASGAGTLNQAEELAAELFAARLAGESTRHGSESLQIELKRLTAELEEEHRRARDLEFERDLLASKLARLMTEGAKRPSAA